MNDEQRTPLQRYEVWHESEPGGTYEFPAPGGSYLRVADLVSGEVGALRWKRTRENVYVLFAPMLDLYLAVTEYCGGWGWTIDDGIEFVSGFPSPEAAMSDAEQWLIQQCGAFILSAIKGREITEG